ncbi:MAG: hypothetical protein V3W44_02510, partial [Dehalococcoidales bacterium]
KPAWPDYWLAKMHTERYNHKAFFGMYFLNQYKYWYDNTLKCKGFSDGCVAASFWFSKENTFV